MIKALEKKPGGGPGYGHIISLKDYWEQRRHYSASCVISIYSVG